MALDERLLYRPMRAGRTPLFAWLVCGPVGIALLGLSWARDTGWVWGSVAAVGFGLFFAAVRQFWFSGPRR